MRIKFLSVTPALYADDVLSTADWYKTWLDFKVELCPPQPPHVAAILWRNEVRLTVREDVACEPPRAPIIYINVRGISELFERLRDRVTVCRSLSQELDGTSTFEIADPNGYVLAFIEEPDAA
jgi:hypothetical protein